MNKSIPTINQSVIDLYDEYTHAPLPRRDFIKRLATLLGSSAAACALLPVLENNYAQAAMIDENDSRISTKRVEFAGPAGTLNAYFAKPNANKKQIGSVLVIHENRGLNAHIQDVARRVALAGYNALALDFLSPLGGTPANEDEARALFAKLDSVQSVANGRAALAYLKTLPNSNGKLGCVGFCWGGAMSNQLAVFAPELSAAVCFYGMAPNLLLVSQIKAHVLLHYAGEDERINASRGAYENALSANKIVFQSFSYEGAQHAFHNDTNVARYNKQAAALAWNRSLELFKKVL
jgi:carboxymethylenebutenolidase